MDGREKEGGHKEKETTCAEKAMEKDERKERGEMETTDGATDVHSYLERASSHHESGKPAAPGPNS